MIFDLWKARRTMNFNRTVRAWHRWLGLFFTLAVLANFIAVAVVGKPPAWITYAPLGPLALIIPSGMYMFFSRATGVSAAG
jgi:hypothetical protein